MKIRKSSWKEIKVENSRNPKLKNKTFPHYSSIAKFLKNKEIVEISVQECSEYLDKKGKIKIMRIFLGKGEIQKIKDMYSYPNRIGLMAGAI